MAGHLHDARECLHQGVITRHGSPYAAGAEGIQVVVQDIGIDSPYGRLADTQTVRHTGPHTLQNHIGARRQSDGSLDSAALFKVQHQAAFARTHMAVRQAQPIDKRWPGTRVVALGRLDLDHVRAQLRQDHGSVGAGHIGRKIGDAHANQRLQRGLAGRNGRVWHGQLLF